MQYPTTRRRTGNYIEEWGLETVAKGGGCYGWRLRGYYVNCSWPRNVPRSLYKAGLAVPGITTEGLVLGKKRILRVCLK